MTEDMANVTTTVTKAVRDAIEHEAHLCGMTISEFAREVLMQHLEGELYAKHPLKVRTLDGRNRIQLPQDLVTALGILPTTPLAIYPFHRGALIRPVR